MLTRFYARLAKRELDMISTLLTQIFKGRDGGGGIGGLAIARDLE